jgi:type III secretion protein C
MAGTACTQRLRQASKWLATCLKRRASAALAAGLLVATTVVTAAPMPNATRTVSITAREQPIAAFLQDLFAAVDVPAVVGPGVTGNVNGTFSGPAEKVLRDVARVYNLVPYYDGAVMHVVPAAEIARRTFAVTPAASERALREVNGLNLPDTRNTLRRSTDGNMVAVGTRRFVEQVDEMLRAGQVQQAAPTAPPGAADFRVFYLRYAWAHDVTTTLGGRQIVLPGVASILRSLVGATGGSLGREVALRPTLPSLKGQGLGGQGVSTRPPTGEAARNASVDGLVAALQRTAQPSDAQVAPTTAPEGHQIRIEADQRLNAVIVRDLAERLPRYEQLIAALDVEPQSLEIEATIIDVNTDKMRELGVDWRWNNDGRSASFSGAVPTTGSGGIASVVLGSANQFLARIRALQTEGAARVVSSPQVVTLSDVEAVFDNSSTFFVRVAGREQVDLFNVSAGTLLRVTPHVFRDRDATRIKLLVNVEDGNLTGRQVDQIPIVERSMINTQALIAEGESLLIGGMVRESTTSGEDKVPGLGDVPVVGNLFKTRTNGTSRIERMFLITPRLAGTRPAPLQHTPSSQRTAAAPAGVVPAATPATAPAAPVITPTVAAAPVATPTAAPLPAPAAAPVATPAVYTPPRRASVEIDLNAALPAAPRPAAAPAIAPAPMPAFVPPLDPRPATGGRVMPPTRVTANN